MPNAPTRDELEILLDIGEDFIIQLIWELPTGPVSVTTPARAEARDMAGNIVIQFATENSGSEATKAAITLSSAAGLIQLTAPRSITKDLPDGRFEIDVFATASTPEAPFTTQQVKLVEGWLIIERRTTVMEVAAL